MNLDRKVFLVAALLSCASVVLAQEEEELNVPLEAAQPALEDIREGAKKIEGRSLEDIFDPGRIPQEALDEIGRRLAPLGWSVDTQKIGKWTVYALEHQDGTLWQTEFPLSFFEQVSRIENPRKLWFDAEQARQLDAIFLVKRPELEKAGWRARYVLAPPGRTSFPELSYEVVSKDDRHRSTTYYSEFLFWLETGPEACWHPELYPGYPERLPPNCKF